MENTANDWKAWPHLAGVIYERPSHYIGATHYGTATFMGRNRDSDMLTESNWEHAVSELTKLHEEDESQWYITRESHWACGWVEFIRIAPTADQAIKDACERMLDRIEDYPILDEDDLSTRELEAAYAYWNNWEDSSDEKPSSSCISHRLGEIKRWNERHAHWPKKHHVPFLAARHSLSEIHDRYSDFGQWIDEISRE